FTISKLSWLHRCEPEKFDRLAHVLLPHDWLTFRMSGRFTTDRGDASGTGYWSPAEDRWRTDLLEVVDETKDWDACLPDVLGPTEVVREREGAGSGPAPATTWPRRSGSGSSRVRSRCRSAPRARCTRSATSPPPTRRA